MKKHIFNITFITLMLTTLSSCEIVGGIFKAGMGVGIFVVVLVVVLIVFLLRRIGKK